MAYRISRERYADMFGPTVGDKVRLADTALLIEIEKDLTAPHYGEEVRFGGGKVIRDGMGQSQATRAEGAVDTVIVNAVILDYWGVIKADIGLKDGRIVAIGKAGNPDVQDGVTIVIGPGTEVIAAAGKIVTAGGLDAHVHFICPQLVEEALCSGLTTLIGGGTVVLRDDSDPAALLASIEADRITDLFLVEPQLVALMDHPDVARRDLSTLRTLTHIGASAPPALRRRARARLGPVLQHTYGASEMGIVSAQRPGEYDPGDPDRATSAGRAGPASSPGPRRG